MNLETMFLPDKAGGIDLTIGLRLGDESFRLRIAGRIARGGARRGRATPTP